MPRPFKVKVIDDVGALPPDAAVCRDENCPVLQAHLAHPVHVRRGRVSSACPNCFKTVKRVDRNTLSCAHCGWTRSKEK